MYNAASSRNMRVVIRAFGGKKSSAGGTKRIQELKAALAQALQEDELLHKRIEQFRASLATPAEGDPPEGAVLRKARKASTS